MSGAALALAPAPLPPWLEAPPTVPEFRSAERLWVISRHADVHAALRHPGIRTAEPEAGLAALVTRAGIDCPYLLVQLRGFLIAANAPWHGRARRFSLLALRTMQAGLAAGALDRVAASVVAALPRGIPFDAMPASGRLPARMLAEGLGIDEAIAEEIAERASAVFMAVRRALPLRLLADFEAQARTLSALISETIAGTPAFEALRRAGREECDLSETEMNAVLSFFFIAATETTSSFLGSALQLLGTHPELVRMIRADPGLLRPAFDELMRYCAPGRSVSLRLAAEPLALPGAEIPAGALLRLDVERAHFDAAVYPDPGRLDPHRREPAHFGFGGGPHACLGMTMAREQSIALFGHLLAACDITPQAAPLEWQEDFYLRRLKHLTLTLTAPDQGSVP